MTESRQITSRPDTDGPRASTLAWIVPNATVFVSSCCVMVIELVAGRIVSRHLGASLYTWTSVIGVILGGLAVGNYVGGRLADRFEPRRTLGVLFLVSSATCVAIVVANHLVGEWSLLWGLAWPARVAVHVALVFFLPAAFLGTIGPVVARMALALGRRTGYTLGTVYAWGVVGSIVGTFATGYVLIAVMRTGAIVWCVAGVLALTGLSYLPRSRRAWAAVGTLIVSFGLAHGSWGWTRSAGERLALREATDPSVVYTDESRYSHIEVRRLSGDDGRLGLYLDRLLHSQLSTQEPDDLHYGYARIFAGLTDDLRRGKGAPSTLTIGGGGYVFPRYLAARWPDGLTEVVEIDPAVTRAATRAFGLPAGTSIVSHHEDGRAFVNDRAHRRRRGATATSYDVVYIDAVNDYSVPHQLTTREFFGRVRDLLAPDGSVMINFIDLVDSGLMLGALASTLGEVFPEVAVFTLDNFDRMTPDSRVTFVLVGSLAPFEAVTRDADRDFVRLSEAMIERYRINAGRLILTDGYAPVERLVAPVVLASATEFAAGEALARALELAERGELDAFIGQCREALRLEPDFPEAHYNLGVGLYGQGRVEEAMTHWGRAIAVKPDHAEAHFNLGAALYAAGRLDRAAGHLTRAIRLKPRLAPAHVALGIVLEARGDLHEASRHYEEALRLDPALTEARGHLTRVRARMAASPPPEPDKGA